MSLKQNDIWIENQRELLEGAYSIDALIEHLGKKTGINPTFNGVKKYSQVKCDCGTRNGFAHWITCAVNQPKK